jgi:Ca2+-dependent lipid-binding protein
MLLLLFSIKPHQYKSTKPDSHHRADPYVQAKHHDQVEKTHKAKHQGDVAVWDPAKDCIELHVHFDSKLTLTVRDADKKEPDDLIGDFKIDLDVLETEHHSTKWYDVYSEDKIVGKIEVEAIYTPDKDRYQQPGLQPKPMYGDKQVNYTEPVEMMTHTGGGGTQKH